MTWHKMAVAAAYPYIPNAHLPTPEDKHLQAVLQAVKRRENVTWRGRTATGGQWFSDTYQPGPRERRFFNRTRTLVPMPRSSITLLPPGPEWPNYEIAQQLVGRGLARDARLLVRRHTAVRSSSSARAASENPPTVEEHIASLAVDGSLLAGVQAITIIDDIVSSGGNTMGACQALRRAGFYGDVSVFAVGYTCYGAGTRGPHYGRIVWADGRDKAFRRPEAEENPLWKPNLDGPWTADPPEENEWGF